MNLTAAIIGLLSAVIGGLLQAVAARRFEGVKFERQNRNDAYLKYLNGISQLTFAPDDNDAIQAAHAVIAEARGRIALCGSDRVVDCMVRVFDAGGDVHSPEARERLKELIAAMREDTLGRSSSASAEDLFAMVYGRDRDERLIQ